MTDHIAVKGIEVFAHHGVYEHEKTEGQLFSIDVELEVDLGPAGQSDDLADTVDYGRLAERIHERVATEQWNLIETVAHRVADLVLEDSRVHGVTVTIHKPQAPISVPFRDVAVTVRRTR
ncbi:MAG TPA: dihydroneopterin aldolase [Acidimicrobiia bacterium]